MKARYSQKIIDAARQMVQKGQSYSEIRARLGIPKSTLSTWFSGKEKKPVSRPRMLEHLAEIRKLATRVIQEKSRERNEIFETLALKAALFEFEKVVMSRSFYKSLLAMLYWAEGAKHEKVYGLKFINTDPFLMHLFLVMLRKSFNIDESKLTITLHLHHYHPVSGTKKFWSDLLHIPLTQFNKIYIKPRSKSRRFRQNFQGICLLYYGDSTIRREMMALASLLQKSIING